MKVVKLSAYLQHNVGDDLMVEILLDRYPDYWFYGCIPHQQKTEKMKNSKYFDVTDIYGNVILGRLNHLVNILTCNKRKDCFFRWVFQRVENLCDTAVAIGGAIYRPVPGETIQERISRESNKHAANNSLHVVGANFGPYEDEVFLRAFEDYFKTCTSVSFRDSQSYELFSKLDNIQWAPDVVFAVPEGVVISGNEVVISVIDLSVRPQLAKYKEAYHNFLMEICKHAIDNDYIPVLTSFCKCEGDQDAIAELLYQLDDHYASKVKCFFYDGNTEKVLDLFRRAGMVIATRFHSMILAMRYGKPLFTISYELKSDNVLRDTASKAWCTLETISKMSAKDVFACSIPPICAKKYVENTGRQFAQLDWALAHGDQNHQK